MLPYLEAMGPLDLDLVGEGLAATVARELARHWRELQAMARGPLGRPRLRVMANHYPRPELPGRCVALVVNFYTVPDAFVVEDEPLLGEFAEAIRRNERPEGLIVQIAKTWQLQGDRARLIETVVDVTRDFRAEAPRWADWSFLGDSRAERMTNDAQRGGHFMPYGGGDRLGVGWWDRSFGLGGAEPMSVAFRFTVLGPAPVSKAEPLPEEAATRLRAFVERS